MIISYQIVLGLGENKELSQIAWSYMNDGLKTDIFIRFTCEAITCACIYLALLKLGITMPDWWDCFDVTEATLQEIRCLS